MAKPVSTRQEAVRELRAELVRSGTPRRDMFLIVLVTGTAGFWLSFALLKLGLDSMWLRYPAAVFGSYAIFASMVRYWVARMQGPEKVRHGSDWIDLPSELPTGIHSAGTDPQFDGGGGFAGGGAGRSWAGSKASVSTPDSSGGGSGFDFSLDLDELLLLLIPLAVIFGVVVYALVAAPAILAEVLLDGALMGGLYHRFKRVPRRHWVRTTYGKTAWLFVVAAILLGLSGLAIQHAYPHATSFGVLWDTVKH